MICKLCLEDKILIKKSHIIPEFMYDGLYNKGHKYAVIDLNDISNKKFRPKGIYDKYILCNNCDNKIISSYETYGAAFISGKSNLTKNFKTKRTLSNDGISSINISNLNYHKFTLFLYSILWRSSISQNYFFEQIKLGKYEDKFRKMILSGDAGPENEHQICIFILQNIDSLFKKGIIQPRHLKSDGNSQYAFYINGIIYYINISEHNKMPIYNRVSLKKDNSMIIPIPEKELAKKLADNFIGKTFINKINSIIH